MEFIKFELAVSRKPEVQPPTELVTAPSLSMLMKRTLLQSYL